MEKLERKSLQETYLQKLIARQQATAIFDCKEAELCQLLKCSRADLSQKIEEARADGMSATALIKLAQFAKASRAMEAAQHAFYAACDARMASAFEECCE